MEKLIILILVSIYCMGNAQEQERLQRIEMPSGKVYEAVTIMKITPAWLKIMHSSGVSKLLLSDCDKEMQDLYSYDREKADAFLNEEAKQSAEYARKEAMRRVADAKVMEQKTKEKQVEEKEYLEFIKQKKLTKERQKFSQKVANKAVKVRLNEGQMNDLGIIGTIIVSRKEMVAKPGSAFEKVAKWKEVTPVHGILSGTKITRRVGITWLGSAWEVGTTSYLSEQGTEVNCLLFTASIEEAEAYYRSKVRESK